MPIAFDTNEVHRYVFSTDRTKPAAERPTLLFRFPTCREARKIANLFDAKDGATVDEWMKLRCDAVRLILVGWENIKDRSGNLVPYDPAELDAVLTDTDLTELQETLLRDMSMSEAEKKRYAFSVLSSLTSSATSVTASA